MKRASLRVLYADNHLLAVAKEAGETMVPDASGDESTLERCKAWVREERAKSGSVFLGVVHRLDRPVSGVALFARTSKAAERLARAFRERAVEKVYWGLTQPPLEPESGEHEQWLSKDPRSNRTRVLQQRAAGAKLARTRWRRLGTTGRGSERTAWVELRPETGRAHQLRALLGSLGAPLLGDLKYGAPRALSDRSIALHAHSLAVPHPIGGVPLRIECPPPDRAWWRLALAR